MLCAECGGAVVTRIVADFRPDQRRVWFWALRCSQCGRLVDAGLRSDARALAFTRELPFRKPPLES
jgi:hypothetical protein